MRTLIVILLAAVLAAPAAAVAAVHDRGDGFVAVKDGKGMFVLNGKGSVLGRVDDGAITITDPNPFDPNRPQVYGWETKTMQGPGTTTYTGTNIRYRFVGTRFRVTVVGSGVAISAVGQGRLTMRAEDGQYALDGAGFQDVPTTFFSGSFGVAAPIVGG